MAGLPAPLVNEAVSDGQGQWLAEPDLAYPAARLAVEYQGADHADPSRLRRDVARHMDLHRAGWQVRYYAGEQVFRHPEVVARDVLAALRRRAPALPAPARGADRPAEERSVALPAPARGADRPAEERSVAQPAPARGADRPPVEHADG
jgi:Protein of unknown function (DUF559)